MTLCIEKRGEIVNQSYLTSERVELVFNMPLSEVVFDARKAQSGDYDGAVQFMLSAVRRMPGNTHVLFNATLALLKHIENCGWNDRFAEQARNMMERARAQDPTNARLPALTAYYYNLLKKYGIQP